MTTQELRKTVITFTDEELRDEIWKPIKDFEDYYEVSSLGRFRNRDRLLTRNNGIQQFTKSKILKNNYYSNHYVQLILYVDKVRFNFIAHRVVAEHFIENPLDVALVNHKNMIKWDNRVSNLEWMTHSENYFHAKENKTWERNVAKGEGAGNAKLNDEDVRYIRKHYVMKNSNSDLYELFKHRIAKSTMDKVARRITWKHIE